MTDEENVTTEKRCLKVFSSPRRPSAKTVEKNRVLKNQLLKRSPSWSPPNFTSTPFDDNQQQSSQKRAENLHKFQKRLFTAAAYDLKNSNSTTFVVDFEDDADIKTVGNSSKDSGYHSLTRLENVSSVVVNENLVNGKPKFTKIRCSSEENNENLGLFFNPLESCQQNNCAIFVTVNNDDNESRANLPAAVYNDPRDPEIVDQVLKNVLGKIKRNSSVPPERLIGHKIGEEYLDIIAELACLQCYPVLHKIFGFLNDIDLVRFASVNGVWRRVLTNDAQINRVRSDYLLKRKQIIAQKATSPNKENSLLKKEDCFSDDNIRSVMIIRHHKPLEVLHNLGNKLQNATVNFFRRSPNKHSPPGKHDLFVKEARNLKKGERLMKCPLCQCPAKVYSVMDKGYCTNSNCGNEFCSRCRGPFHSSSINCVVDPDNSRKFTQTVVCSEKSKRNLRRLL